MGEVLEVL